MIRGIRFLAVSFVRGADFDTGAHVLIITEDGTIIRASSDGVVESLGRLVDVEVEVDEEEPAWVDIELRGTRNSVTFSILRTCRVKFDGRTLWLKYEYREFGDVLIEETILITDPTIASKTVAALGLG